MANKSRIFISFSKDFGFALKLKDVLEEHGFDIWIYLEDIPPTVDWLEEIYDGIKSSDIFLFLLSPDSIISETCKKEIDFASNRKRIIPILVREVDWKDVSEKVSRFQAISFQEKDNFDLAFKALLEAINTDFAWVRFHKKLDGKADDWEHHKDGSRLLRGKELQEADQQLANAGTYKDPQPTPLQRQYILASRKDEEHRRRRTTIGLAIGFAVMTVLCFVAVISSFVAVGQRNEAVTQSNARATAQVEAQQQAKIALAGKLAAQAQLILNKKEDANSPLIASLLAIESIQRYPNAEADKTLRESVNLLVPTYKDIPTTHTEAISTIVFSPDGRFVASSDFDSNIKIWDINNGEEIASLKDNGKVTIMKFSLNGKLLFTGSDYGDITSWDTRNGSSTTFDNHGEGYVKLDISPNGNMLIASGADGIIKIWHIETSGLVFDLNHGSAIKDLKFSPDGTKIVSSGEDNIIKVWDATTGKEEYRRPTNYFGAYSVNISPDSKRVVSGSDKGVEIWDISSGETIRTLTDNNFSADDTGFFSPNGKLVATYRGYNNGHVVIRDSESGRQISVITLDFYISDMAFSYDSKYMITGSEDGSTRLWEIETGREVSRMLQKGRIYSVELTSKGEVLASAGVDKIIHFWDFSYFNEPSAQSNNKVKENFMLDTNGKWIASWSQDSNKIEMLQISTNTIVSSIVNATPVVTVDISSDGEFIVLAGVDNIVCVWKIISLEKVTCQPHAEQVSSLKFSHNSNWVASEEGKTIKVWDAKTGDEIANLTTDFVISTFVFSSNDQLVSIGAGGDYKIDIWNVLNQQKIAELQHDSSVKIDDLIFSKNGKWLISSSIDSTARVWSLETMQEVSRITYDPQEYTNMYEVLKTRISPDEKELLSVNTVAIFNINNNAVTARESTIRIWDLLSGQEIIRVIHNSWVNDVVWSPDGNYVFSGGWDGVVRIWDANSGNEVGRIAHDAQIKSLAFTPDGLQIISISSDGGYKVSYWKPEDVIAQACSRLTRNLSLLEWAKLFGNIEYHTTCSNLPAGDK